MIWYFLAGLIAGAVGWHKLIQWLGGKIQQEKMLKELEGDNDDRS